MPGERSDRSGPLARAADPADIDGLQAVLSASLAMADRLRSEAASTLLRRALALLQDSGRDAGPGPGAPTTFIPS